MTADEFDVKVNGVARDYCDNVKESFLALQKNINVLVTEAEASGIPEHLLTASLMNALQMAIGLQDELVKAVESV